jgi:hypothetical protein
MFTNLNVTVGPFAKLLSYLPACILICVIQENCCSIQLSTRPEDKNKLGSDKKINTL